MNLLKPELLRRYFPWMLMNYAAELLPNATEANYPDK